MIQKSYDGSPTLYIVPTPIGNLEDITIRALNILKEVDVIFAEDTRTTKQLLNHFDINNRLISSHLYNEEQNEEKEIDYLKEGKNIAVVSDRGTPVISDPGYILVKNSIEHGYNVVYGNTSNDAVLRDFGLAPRRTRAVVVALDNIATARRTIHTVRNIAPRVKIFARARNLADTHELLKLNVTEALPETIESSFMLGSGVLSHLGVPDSKIAALLDTMRADNYSGIDGTIADRN